MLNCDININHIVKPYFSNLRQEFTHFVWVYGKLKYLLSDQAETDIMKMNLIYQVDYIHDAFSF